MTRNGLEATEDWCCQVVMYIGTWEVPSSSTWQDGDWVVIADPIQVTETRWNPFAITHEGNQAYLGGITKQEWLNPPTTEGAVEPEEGAGRSLSSTFASMAAAAMVFQQ